MLLKLVQNQSFNPEQINVMVEAYEAARLKLGLTTRDDPVTQLLASKILELAQPGLDNDPNSLCERAVAQMKPRADIP